MKNLKSRSIFLLPIFMILGLFQGRAQYSVTYQNGEPLEGATFQRVAVDGLGNSYYTGTFVDSIHLGSVTVYQPANLLSIAYFFGKMDASGSWVWARSIPPGSGGASITISNIAADNSGNSYITGTFRGSAVFDGTTLNSVNRNSLFVAKMNSSGSFLWAVSKAPNFNYSGAWGRGITADASGNVYVTGHITVKTGSPTIDGIYWAKYNSSGVKQWENTLSPSNGSYSSGYAAIENRGIEIAVDGSGFVYVTGNFQGSVKFANGAGNTISSSHQGAFATKLNSSGAVQWVKAATPSTPNSSSNPRVISPGLYLDATGNVYIGGQFSGANLLFPGSASTLANPTTAYYGFLAKYSSSGALSWAVAVTDSVSIQFGFSLFKQPSGNVGAVYVRKGASIIYDYSSSGSLVSSSSSTGAGITSWLLLWDAAATSTGYILCGNVWGTTTVDNLTLTATCPYPISNGCNHGDMLVFSYTGSAAKTTGIAESSSNPAMHLQAYPNPVNDILHLRNTNGSNIGTVAIYDQTGRKVIEKTFSENHAQLDMLTLPAGVYFLKADHRAGVIKLLKTE